MNRVEIEIQLNKDRAWLLETYAALPEEDRTRAATPSEHDPSSSWSALDHLAHLSGIEKNFNRMIRRHLAGDANPVGLRNRDDGSERPREEVMRGVHEMTEAWVRQHRGKSFDEVVALTQEVRADTLGLLSSLSDEQLRETLPGAPWADGTIGGVLWVNAGHGRTHYNWVKEGWAAQAAAAAPGGR